MPLSPTTATIITRLVDELSSELDLHYDNSDMPALDDTMSALVDATDLLMAHNYEPPETYRHIMDRYIASGAVEYHNHSTDKH